MTSVGVLVPVRGRLRIWRRRSTRSSASRRAGLAVAALAEAASLEPAGERERLLRALLAIPGLRGVLGAARRTARSALVRAQSRVNGGHRGVWVGPREGLNWSPLAAPCAANRNQFPWPLPRCPLFAGA
jgi:hypothetical protein